MNREQRLAAVCLAAQALAFARVDDWSRAGDVVQELHDTYAGEGVQVMLIALADTLLMYQGGYKDPQRPDAVVLPMWIDTSTGSTALADDVPPPIRWAGRFIAARAALDEDACAALWNSVTTDEEFTENICATLEMVAVSLNVIKGVPQ
jgi:hypothetical protein